MSRDQYSIFYRGLKFLVLLFLLGTVGVSRAADNIPIEEALLMITSFADDICEEAPPPEGEREEVSAFMEGSIEFKHLIRDLTGIGVSGGAKYERGKYRGVLQEDLADVLWKHIDCRQEIANTLIEKLLPEGTRKIGEPVTCAFKFDNTRDLTMEGNGTDWYHCKKNRLVSQVYYYDGDLGRGRDDSIEKIRCASPVVHDSCYMGFGAVLEGEKIQRIELEGRGNGWYECPRGYAVMGVYYVDEGDDAVREMKCRKMTLFSAGEQCEFDFDKEEDILINDRRTRWFKCPTSYVIIGVYYDDEGDDNSVERLLCSRITVTCT